MTIPGSHVLFFSGKSLMLLMQLSYYSRKIRFEDFCHSHGIQQEFLSPITPQQNGVVERKNKVIQEMARVMIHSKNLAKHFWGEAVNTACHIINKVYLQLETNKTPY
jgi:hypothetical protein